MYYFSEENQRGNHAGTKARNDVENILKELQAVPVNSKTLILKTDSSDSVIYSNIQSRLDYIRYFIDAKKIKNEIVFIQYPMLTFDAVEKYIRILAKKNKIVFLIHDVHGLRRKNQDAIKREIEILNLGYAVILHNRFMEAALKQWGLSCPHIFKLNIFDYLCDDKNFNRKNQDLSDVVFAGNLEKSLFMEEFIKNNHEISIQLFGSGWQERWEKYKNVKYIGNFLPDEIPFELSGKFGLVWDGEDIKSGSGVWGEYTKINNPHKFSLYIAAGIPVIAWKEAAIAEYIQEHHLGIVVETLENMHDIIANISDEDYQLFCTNVKKVREEIICGSVLKGIMKEL